MKTVLGKVHLVQRWQPAPLTGVAAAVMQAKAAKVKAKRDQRQLAKCEAALRRMEQKQGREAARRAATGLGQGAREEAGSQHDDAV